MPPRRRSTRQEQMPSSQEELDALIAAAIAQHDANRSELSGGTDRRERADAGIIKLKHK